MAVSETERTFRRRWYEAHRDGLLANEERHRQSRAEVEGFVQSAPEALGLLDYLRSAGDLDSFVQSMQKWAVKPGTLAFNGMSGQGTLHLMAKHATSPRELATVLGEALTAPISDDEAAKKIQAVVNYVEAVQVKGRPAPGNVPFLLSYFWSLADQRNWSVIWPSAAAFTEFLMGDDLPADFAFRYLAYMAGVREMTTDIAEFEITAAWWRSQKVVLLDEVLADRAGYGLGGTDADQDEAGANACTLARVSECWGKFLVDEVLAVLGRRYTPLKVSPRWEDERPRSDVKVDLRQKDSNLFFRIWVNDRGAAVGLSTGPKNRWWYADAVPIIQAARYPDCRILSGPESDLGDDVGFFGNPSEFVYGRWFERDQFGQIDLRATVVDVATTLKPLYEELGTLARSESSKPRTSPEEPAQTKDRGGDEFAGMAAQWLVDEQYPSSWHEDNHAQREQWAEMLAPDSITAASLEDLRQVWMKKRGADYGSAGIKPQLNQTLRDFDEPDYAEFLKSLHYLCWGDDPHPVRIDRLLDKADLGIRGLGESLIMKLLAITHPEEFLLIYPMGQKREILRLLKLEQPSGSLGTQHVEANRLLIERLKGCFSGERWGLSLDPLAMSGFLYHLLWRSEQQDDDLGDLLDGPKQDPLDDLSEELLVAREFLDEVVELLEDKGQVVFYGPPGTGKTYLARKLAEALAPNPRRRKLVQFHPASSYEDFFEGYRPEADSHGEMAYSLTPGPLALLAEKAAEAPGQRHVMVIDEINRANLPKVLGELLFLLEYRDENVSTLYRADDEFELPENLWFIATMNTADRSIALVDAALRRRFHFVPFFPNFGPMEGLLDRWLEKNGEPTWVGELVAHVNEELEQVLGGPHLQIGPSHFMKENLDKNSASRIWKYNIEPFIEDQLYGDQGQIEKYRFDNVYRRHVESADTTGIIAPGLSPDQTKEAETASEQDPANR
ncbi:McrB family protein [Candidatus Poriferisocius sp.]|uniref:McrB family protein n=1 Tax=Candidatus Poriferisocius sp. TaxID=3101276 RepID=UPI003B5C1C4F